MTSNTLHYKESKQLSNDIVQKIIRIACTLGIEESTRKAPCPFCGKNEGDFCVTRLYTGILYKCFRNKCNKSGYIRNLNTMELQEKKPDITVPDKELHADLCNLSKEQLTFFNNKFTLTENTLNAFDIKWAPTLARITIPCRSKNGQMVGHIARYYKELNNGEERLPKVLTFVKKDAPIIYFSAICSPRRKIVFIVEDAISAMRLWQNGHNAVALLGTHVHPALAAAFSAWHVFLCLDADALAKACKIKNKFSLVWKSCELVALTKDIKDMPNDKTFKEFLFFLMEEYEIEHKQRKVV